MKLLLTLFFSTNLFSLHAQTWPQHPKTGKVDFHGLLPWPVGVITDSARQALAGEWYLHKLTNWNRLAVSETAAPPYTYGGWPTRVRLQHIEPPGLLVQLQYTVHLSASKAGLRYHFSNFSCLRTEGRDKDTAPIVPLEDLVKTPRQPVAGQASLAWFRQRLTEAITHW
jgi:hypothetical protein